MAVNAELSALQRAIGDLQQCAHALQTRYGDIPGVRRLLNDVERLSIDAAELEAIPPPTTSPKADEVQILTDEPYDPALWTDADDEGVGGYQRNQP